MTAQVTGGPHPVQAPSLPRWHRVIGFGSIFAKTVRDSRLAFLIVAGMTAGLMLSVTAAIPAAFPTQEARDQMARLATEMGTIAQGISGKPVNVGTLGGYAQWKYGAFFVFIVSIWSILALSGTLAGEARRGSLDLLAVTPLGRRRIAWEKVAAHLATMAVVLGILTAATWFAGVAYGTLPGDAIPLDAAIGFSLHIGVMALAFGGLAFLLSQYLGRGAGAGIAGLALLAGWILNGYQSIVSAFGPFAALTPWAWTADHLPLAGQADPVSLVPVALVTAVLLPAGVRAFGRRDLGATTAVRLPRFLALPLGLGGPVRRSLGERLPVALAWGLAMAVVGMIVAASSRSFADELRKLPDVLQVFIAAFPGADMTSAGGFLQFAFGQLGFIVVGFAAATLVAGWASDERSGRVELLLTTPRARRAWLARSALGALAAIGVLTAIVAVGLGLGSASAGSDPVGPMLGTVVLGLYAAAIAGIGFAIGGLWRPGVAAEIAALVVIATFLLDLLAPLFELPDALRQLALTVHLGMPMLGVWDWAGMAACLVLAIGGLLVGAWGFGRRDVRD